MQEGLGALVPCALLLWQLGAQWPHGPEGPQQLVSFPWPLEWESPSLLTAAFQKNSFPEPQPNASSGWILRPS